MRGHVIPIPRVLGACYAIGRWVSNRLPITEEQVGAVAVYTSARRWLPRDDVTLRGSWTAAPCSPVYNSRDRPDWGQLSTHGAVRSARRKGHRTAAYSAAERRTVPDSARRTPDSAGQCSTTHRNMKVGDRHGAGVAAVELSVYR